jgi:hypothetical protein
MEVKEAVALAKQSISEVFAEEPMIDLGLEEVEFDDSSGAWLITFGFSRPWDDIKIANPFAAIGGVKKKREYKVVRVSDGDKKMLSVKNREPAV